MKFCAFRMVLHILNRGKIEGSETLIMARQLLSRRFNRLSLKCHFIIRKRVNASVDGTCNADACVLCI